MHSGPHPGSIDEIAVPGDVDVVVHRHIPAAHETAQRSVAEIARPQRPTEEDREPFGVDQRAVAEQQATAGNGWLVGHAQ